MFDASLCSQAQQLGEVMYSSLRTILIYYNLGLSFIALAIVLIGYDINVRTNSVNSDDLNQFIWR